jgi:hypothetical protein
MNQLVKDLEEVIEKKVDNHELKQELSSLLKMLKTGFENKNIGMDKIPKLYASNDEKKIAKFYDTVGNQIYGLKLSGNFDKFVTYLKITFGINIEFTSETSPNVKYIKTKKKAQKFNDLFSMYFLEDAPKDPKTAVTKILNSLDKLTKEYNTESDIVKESLKAIVEKQTEHSPATVKTVDKILTSARIKALKIEDVANEVEANLNLQLQGIDILLDQNGDDDDITT